MTCRSDPRHPRTGICQACGRTFEFPSTGPIRLFCADPICKDRRHARACWSTYQRRLEADAQVVHGISLDGSVPDPVKIASFSSRFRGADQAALLYEIIVTRDLCSYCGLAGQEGMGPDHIVPFHAGGGGEWENLTGACRRCNSSKGDRKLLLWLLESPRLNQLRALENQLAFAI